MGKSKVLVEENEQVLKILLRNFQLRLAPFYHD
jgi:hypothetical protein